MNCLELDNDEGFLAPSVPGKAYNAKDKNRMTLTVTESEVGGGSSV